jgi:hypothetical protein
MSFEGVRRNVIAIEKNENAKTSHSASHFPRVDP